MTTPSSRLRAVSLLLFVWVLLSVAPGGQTNTAVPQRSGVAITGSVVNASLSPIAGVVVTLERGGQVVTKTTTDAAGVFRFANVAPGAYRVRAEAAGFPAFARDFRVPNGATNLQLPLVLSRPEDDVRVVTDQLQVAAKGVASGLSPAVASAPPPAAAGGAGGRGGGAPGPMSVTGLVGLAERVQPGVYDQRYRDAPDEPWTGYRYPQSRDRYAHVAPHQFQSARNQPLSTFGADVDTASYANVRRFLSTGQLPPQDAVRVEEFVNYFRFAYDEPRGNKPLALTTEVGNCPWAPSHKLVLIGARARAAVAREIEGRNIVLLIDVSGSMAPADRLPLIRTALGMFVDTLQPDDRIAIVTYAGNSGVALPSTPARRRDVIQRAIAGLGAGGSTNGAQGLITAYRVAREAFIPGGVNRVILATDGDFNVGITSQRDLLHLIEREKDSGVFLSVFGVGTGNLQDRTMEMLADKGNGHYAYLDSLQEARRVLVSEGGATLETVAKDVKFQVEFNPAIVSAWKLIGYENRVMAAEDFNNDRKDGGEMGAGHTVTVLYEVIPVGVKEEGVDPLKYQQDTRERQDAQGKPGAFATEWLTVKARYKTPEGEKSELITQPVHTSGDGARAVDRAKHLPFASAVAEFGVLLRSGSRDGERWDALTERVARLEPSADKDGFKELVAIARGLARLR